MSKNIHIKKNDVVMVVTGEDKGKKGKVLSVDTAKGRVVIEGVNMATKHKKPRRQGDIGGIIHQEAAINATNVMHVCDKCQKPTRIGNHYTYKFDILSDGSY